MALDQNNITFKTVLSKRFTTPEREFYQEDGGTTMNIHITEVWADTIPSDPGLAVTNGTAVYYNKQILTPDPVYASSAFFFMVDNLSFVAGVDDYDTGMLNDAQRIGFISDKYGQLYDIKLYSYDNVLISKTDKIGWFFNYATGVLHISSPGSYTTPYKLSVYRYIGSNIPDISGLKARKFNLTDKNLTALVTTVDGDQATTQVVSQIPFANSGVRVYVNNTRVESGSDPNDFCYFSGDNGVTKRNFGYEQLGDKLFWVGSVAKYQLEADDLITFDYLVD